MPFQSAGTRPSVAPAASRRYAEGCSLRISVAGSVTGASSPSNSAWKSVPIRVSTVEVFVSAPIPVPSGQLNKVPRRLRLRLPASTVIRFSPGCACPCGPTSERTSGRSGRCAWIRSEPGPQCRKGLLLVGRGSWQAGTHMGSKGAQLTSTNTDVVEGDPHCDRYTVLDDHRFQRRPLGATSEGGTNLRSFKQGRDQNNRAGCVPSHSGGTPWRAHMHPLTLICIVLTAAVLWMVFTWGMLARLARSERRAGQRAPRKSADAFGRRHGVGTRRGLKVRRRRTSRRVAVHRPIR